MPSSFTLVVLMVMLWGLLDAKAPKKQFGATQNGKMPEDLRKKMAAEIAFAQSQMTDEHYADVVQDPRNARNDQERLAAMAGREVFVLIDRSGSMGSRDEDPTGAKTNLRSWTRWDSARVAAESIAELALSIDADDNVDIMLWDGQGAGVRSVHTSMKTVADIGPLFKEYEPAGGTPLAEALEEIYELKLHALLEAGEPFTCIVLTDGQPNDPWAVKQFFGRIIQENGLEQPERQTLAAFSFVRMGDDRGAIKFLKDLDDNLQKELKVKVDIVDTKEDNFLFGTGKYKRTQGVGPFALFWDAIYD